jgi:hypothetical protein
MASSVSANRTEQLYVSEHGCDIVAQFLTEATLLSIIGGLLGVAAGLAVAVALPHLTDQRTIVSYPAAALALGSPRWSASSPGSGRPTRPPRSTPPPPCATNEEATRVQAATVEPYKRLRTAVA